MSGWVAVTQSLIDGFANLTGDTEWIHVEPERAASGPFGATIAHGFLTLSLIPGLARQIFRFELERATVNYGLAKVRFPHPVRVDTRVRVRCRLVGLEDHRAGTLIRLEYHMESEQPVATVCVAESLLLALH